MHKANLHSYPRCQAPSNQQQNQSGSIIKGVTIIVHATCHFATIYFNEVNKEKAVLYISYSIFTLFSSFLMLNFVICICITI